MSKDSGRNVLDKIYERAQKVKELVGPEDVSHGCSDILGKSVRTWLNIFIRPMTKLLHEME